MSDMNDKKSDKDHIHSSETSYDTIRKIEEQKTQILNSQIMQVEAADSIAKQIRIQQESFIQALQPLQDVVQPYNKLIEQNKLCLTAATASLSSMAQILVTDDALSSMTGALNIVVTAMQPYRDINQFYSGVLAAVEATTIRRVYDNIYTQL